MSPRATKLTLLASLYVSQAIPLGFFVTAMPVILRDSGVSLETAGLFGAVALPWMVKWAWAPLVDRFGSRRRGHYRSWILPLQTLSVACVVAVALLDLDTRLAAVAVVATVFMLVAATQDVATDGLAVRSLSHEERGPGNGLQVAGYYLGQVLGGGVLLMAFARFGWTPALLAMAACLALPLVPAARFREPVHRHEPGGADASPRRLDYRALGRFFTRPGAGPWVAVLLLFRSGETMATYVYNQMLVDLGFSVDEIGFVAGVLGAVAALAGALLGGTLVVHLGRRPSLVAFGLVQAGALGTYALPAAGFGAPAVVYSAAMAVAFAGGLATAALYTAMMDASDERTAATDFTLQQSLCAVGPLAGVGVSGFAAAGLGFAGHFGLCAAIALAAVALLLAVPLPVRPSPRPVESAAG